MESCHPLWLKWGPFGKSGETIMNGALRVHFYSIWVGTLDPPARERLTQIETRNGHAQRTSRFSA